MSPFGRRRRPPEQEDKLPGLLAMLMQTAVDVQKQYDASGRPDELEFAIETWSQLRGLVQREPEAAAAALGHDLIPRSLNELGLDLLDAAKTDPGTERYHAAVEVLHEAAAWAAPGSVWGTRTLMNASHVLMSCWERSGAPTDLDAAVAAGHAAIEAGPATPADRATALNVLGNALRTRGRAGGSAADLRQAVDAHGEAVAITGTDTPDTARFLVNLGRAQRALAQAAGEPALLDAAVATFRRARAEVRDPRDLMPTLEGLQESLGERGTPADLTAQAEVLAAIASEHDDVPVLEATDLVLQSHVLRTLAGMSDDSEALERAVAVARRARELGAPEPEVRARACEALSEALSARFDASRSQRDLDEAIALRQEAVAAAEPPRG